MKIIFSLFILFFSPSIALCQLNDAKSFTDAINLAKKKDKPLLLIISLSPKYATYVEANAGLQDKEVKDKLRDNFIVFSTTRTDTSVWQAVSSYKINSFPTFVFMHANKDVFHKDFGLSISKHKYLSMLATATTLSKEKPISILEKEYLADKSDNYNLKKLIDLRLKNGITNNAELIEQFASNLKIGDFNDYQTVLFILQAGPFADGTAYRLAYTNKKITDSIYKTEPLQKRIDMNNAIIQNTLSNAIKTKNIRQAQSAANMTRSTNGNNYRVGYKNAENNMLFYFKSVKDTGNYIQNAIRYYDAYYMNISADSIKNIEVKQRQLAIEKSKPSLPAGANTVSKNTLDSLLKANPNSVRTETRVVSTIANMSNSYANELNSGAWSIYETGTKNINHLLKAVTWSTRSIELQSISSYHDTLAHLFYRLGYFEQAVKAQATAIDLAKIEGRPYESLQQELKKIKNKEL
ncbi:MAG: hypothetical protein EOO96_20910 [Pedobacter sp.]|nr:MAG: hypothetical protein EOO96_20910 [Pedobacter sp.]